MFPRGLQLFAHRGFDRIARAFAFSDLPEERFWMQNCFLSGIGQNRFPNPANDGPLQVTV